MYSVQVLLYVKPHSQVNFLQYITIQTTTPMKVTVEANAVNSGFKHLTFWVDLALATLEAEARMIVETNTWRW